MILRVLRALGVLIGLGPATVLAQREPVLDQVRVPHSYYYREMYLPQATSGPTAPSWAPDGIELAYSMQGTLWRQRIDSGEARQLTDGPGYDYQPDWSPDGRRMVYASYDGAEVELRLLDLATGTSRTLVRNGAVNVDPRWSPDGRRVAYVSTAFEGRFHVFVVTVEADGAAGEPLRITEDRHGGLPRYYYHAYDQYLAPAWSPEGRELLLLSNRGHVWGSGTIWRMEARPGGVMREIRDEETTWRADPDWAPDGRRAVYSSYLGGQWHQLWLMTADGESPFQLTYGEFDATMPRWSPDGRRIAFISNPDGNTSLRVLELPGARIRALRAAPRRYLRPTGTLALAITDGRSGRAVAARVSVVAPDGRSYAPDDAWRHADDGFTRAERRFESAYFHARGAARLTVPAGEISIEVSRGPEYRVARQRVRVAAGRTTPVRLALERLDDLAARGWWSGDLHVHMNYGGHYRATPATLRAQAEAEDLHVVENLIVNKEGRVPDVAYFTGGRPDPVSTPGRLILHGEEFHTSFWGHTGLLGLREHLLLPTYAAYQRTAAASPQPTNANVFDLAHAQGALAGYVHPFDAYPDPAAPDPLTHALPVDVALGKVDYVEVVGFSDHLASARVWYQLLNCGFRLPAGAGTDAMTNFASLRGPLGTTRVYVRTGGPLTAERFHAGLRAGRTMATNGPLVSLTLGGRAAGDEIRLPAGPHRLRVRATLRSYVPVDHFELIGNGEVVTAFPLRGDRDRAAIDTVIRVERSGWYAVRAWADRATHPVLDLYPFGTTGPVYVTVGGAPIRSPVDARHFLAWIDHIDSAARGRSDWNSPGERDAALEEIARAREVFRTRATQSGANAAGQR
ncbi:MAG TPA: CehA/McbA family metallohydrolase [Gemmatimonadales bacterium]|nr:CehA/McbA family metallohydrolase [Gemmatimonadales bacterium]